MPIYSSLGLSRCELLNILVLCVSSIIRWERRSDNRLVDHEKTMKNSKLVKWTLDFLWTPSVILPHVKEEKNLHGKNRF